MLLGPVTAMSPIVQGYLQALARIVGSATALCLTTFFPVSCASHDDERKKLTRMTFKQGQFESRNDYGS